MNEIRLFRLTSGEEILVTLLTENEHRTIVKDPVLLIPNKNQIGFMPYLSYCKIETLEIKEDHIMFNLIPTDDLKKQYEAMVHGPDKIKTPEILKILT
tara:strand:+ start:111 stop:404 length:294 start_codon:yes stop_codon:yes gene_type:complete